MLQCESNIVPTILIVIERLKRYYTKQQEIECGVVLPLENILLVDLALVVLENLGFSALLMSLVSAEPECAIRCALI